MSLPPPPPEAAEHLPFPRQSRYQRRKRPIAWWPLFFGWIIGLSGALYYAWNVAPLAQFDTAPRQLRPDAKADYAIAAALHFAYDSDLSKAVERMIALNLGPDPFQALADIACDLARGGYVDSTAGLRAVRTLRTFYQLQGKQGCADQLIPDADVAAIVTVVVPTATATLPPPPSKTPPPQTVPTNPSLLVVPTTPPRRLYQGRVLNTYCDLELSGLIEVYVQDFQGRPLPGERVRVRWDGGSDTFVVGLKPERGLNYADFQMEEGRGYIVDMPGLSDPLPNPLVANPCITTRGEAAITSYRVIFTQIG